MIADAGLDTNTPFGQCLPALWDRWIWKLCDWSMLPPETRRKLRKRFARRVTGPFDVVFEGMNFRLYPAENYCDRIIFGRHELPEKAEHIALLPLLHPNMVFVDIGANVGSYSVFVARHAGQGVKILALEPHPRTYRKLLFNLAANGVASDHVVNCGVGPEHAQMDLWSDGGSNIGHTSMLREGTSNPKTSVKVAVAPLMDILAERRIKRIDLLKIDIEGFEDRALAPFFRAADTAFYPRHVLIEVAHKNLWAVDLLALMLHLGYREIFRTGENILFSLHPATG